MSAHAFPLPLSWFVVVLFLSSIASAHPYMQMLCLPRFRTAWVVCRTCTPFALAAQQSILPSCAVLCCASRCVSRFANPASLNGATSWVFLNSPENVQHVCATNVKNYNMRYLPVSTLLGHPGLMVEGETPLRHKQWCHAVSANKVGYALPVTHSTCLVVCLTGI